MLSGKPEYTVSVVGAGAAGTLTAMRLLQHAGRSQIPLQVLLIDPAEATGRGPAYTTGDQRHLLNVRAGGMSAYTEDPDHFVRWLRKNASEQVDPAAFVPRRLFGAYLAAVLEDTAKMQQAARLRRVHGRVVGLSRAGSGFCLSLGSGEPVHADAVVLALGNFTPGCDWAPAALRVSRHFIRDPWVPGALASVPARGDVLLVGSGLTMVDLAIALDTPGRVVHAVSRSGLIPQSHTRTPAPAAPAPQLPAGAELDSLRTAVLRHVAEVRRVHGDWRPAMDSLRPLTNSLWQQLSAQDRARFLEQDLRIWDVHRHRIPPAAAAKINAAQADGRLKVSAGEVAEAVETDDGLQIRLSTRQVLHVGAVVNCTGPQQKPEQVADPLVRDLLGSGLARVGRHGLGFHCSEEGRLRSADQLTEAGADLITGPVADPLVWAIGSLRRGDLFETTAIPEIRVQAKEIAQAVLHQAMDRQHVLVS